MGFKIHCTINNNCNKFTNYESISSEINIRVSSEINELKLVTADKLQESVSSKIIEHNLVTADKLQESVSSELDSRMLVTINQLQESVSSELNSRMIVTIDQLNERLQQFINNPQSEINKVKLIDISSILIENFYLQNEHEFVVLLNDNQNTTNTTTIYLPPINDVTGIEITIINLSGNDVNIKTLADDINDINNGDYFYDTPLQSSILLCSNYSLRFISYTSNRWVNII